MKVEQALRILPPLESLVPLRAALLATSSTGQGGWAGSVRDLTLGRREVVRGALKSQMASRIAETVEHLTALYESYEKAVDALESDDPATAAAMLLGAGHREHRSGRHEAACAWSRLALDVAAGLHDRRPEVEALLLLGTASSAAGRLPDAARNFQRALVLAEAERDDHSVMRACEALGRLAAERSAGAGAHAWFARALHAAERGSDNEGAGRSHHALGELARRAGQFTLARQELRLAREKFEAIPGGAEMAPILATEAMLLADMGLPERAAAAYREALAWIWQRRGTPEMEISVRLAFARFHIASANFPDAEEEIRKAEQLALSGGRLRSLVDVYTLLGRIRGIQRDEPGFVFFEQALELVAMLEASPSSLAADVYHEYAAFKAALGQPDESEAYRERALEIFASSGAGD